MSAGFNLAEATVFIPEAVLHPVIGEFRKAGLAVLPHPVPAVHHDKDGSTPGRMIDVLGFYSPLAKTLAEILSANSLNGLNDPVIIFPFILSE